VIVRQSDRYLMNDPATETEASAIGSPAMLNALPADSVEVGAKIDAGGEYASDSNSRRIRKAHVLVVDDNSDMRSLLEIVLERAGFETEVAADGDLALDLQRGHPADVLITDIFMPERDGIELISAFKSRFPQVKIIAMSGGGQRARADYLTVASEIGADAVLRKPFATETLVTTLEYLVRR
jgi:CheY-like chemotaxis protein